MKTIYYLCKLCNNPWQRALNTCPKPIFPKVILVTLAQASGKCLSPNRVGCIFKFEEAESSMLSSRSLSQTLAAIKKIMQTFACNIKNAYIEVR